VGLRPELLSGRWLVAVALMRLGRHAEVRAAASELLALAPEHRLSRIRAAMMYRDGDYVDAYTAFVIEGPAAEIYAEVFAADWLFAAGEDLRAERPRAPPARAAGPGVVQVVPGGPEM
jgi:hypothetical protein